MSTRTSGFATKKFGRELASVTDNPIVAGTPDSPQIYSQANPVGADIGLAMDQIAVAMAELGGISGCRLERVVNPLISGLPAFFAQPGGTASPITLNGDRSMGSSVKLSLAISAVLAGHSIEFADAAAAAAADDTDSSSAISEIVVTAQRRSENL